MILVVGLDDIQEHELPMQDVIEYKILTSAQTKMLPLLGKKEDCTTILIHKSMQSTLNINSVIEKVVFVTSIQDIETVMKGQEITVTLEDEFERLKRGITEEIPIPQANEEPTKEEPTLEEPTLGASITEEPVNEEPLNEEPLNEEPEEEELEVPDTNSKPENDLQHNTVEIVQDDVDLVQDDVVMDLSSVIEEKNPLHWEETEKENKLEARIVRLEQELAESEESRLKLVTSTSLLKRNEANLKETIGSLEVEIEKTSVKLDKALQIAQSKLKQQQESFNSKIRIANTTIQDLSRKVLDSNVKEATKQCDIFSEYVVEPKAVVKIPFTESEKMRVGVLNTQVHILATKGTDSLVILQEEIIKLMKTNKPCVIVDFTGDLYMLNKYGIKVQATSLDLTKHHVKDVAVSRGSIDFIPTSSFNDIALCAMQWDSIINKLIQYAEGRPILLLMNDIDRFSTRFVVSRLGEGVANVTIVTNATPSNMTTLQTAQMYLPHIQKRVMLMNFTEPFREITQQLSKYFKIVPLNDVIDWTSFGIR